MKRVTLNDGRDKKRDKYEYPYMVHFPIEETRDVDSFYLRSNELRQLLEEGSEVYDEGEKLNLND